MATTRQLRRTLGEVGRQTPLAAAAQRTHARTVKLRGWQVGSGSSTRCAAEALLSLLGRQEARNREGARCLIARLRAIDTLWRATRGPRGRDAAESGPCRISVLPVGLVLDDYLDTPPGPGGTTPSELMNTMNG